MIEEFVPKYKTDHTANHINLTFMDWYVKTFRPKSYIEIGVFQGDTFFAVAESMERERIENSICVGVDPWDSPGQPEYAESDKRAHHMVLKEAVVRRRENRFCSVQELRMRSGDTGLTDKVSTKWLHSSFDLAFIDGNHSYESVVQDYNMVIRLASIDGAIMLHDTNWPDNVAGCGPARLLENVCHKQPVLQFDHALGFGIVFGPQAFDKIPVVDRFKTQLLIQRALCEKK